MAPCYARKKILFYVAFFYPSYINIKENFRMDQRNGIVIATTFYVASFMLLISILNEQ
jgi:hypothetical protein